MMEFQHLSSSAHIAVLLHVELAEGPANHANVKSLSPRVGEEKTAIMLRYLLH